MGTRIYRSALTVFLCVMVSQTALADKKGDAFDHASPGQTASGNGGQGDQAEHPAPAAIPNAPAFWKELPQDFVELAQKYCFTHVIATYNAYRVTWGNQGMTPKLYNFGMCNLTGLREFPPGIWNFQAGLAENPELQAGYHDLNKGLADDKKTSGDQLWGVAGMLERDRLSLAPADLPEYKDFHGINMFVALFNPNAGPVDKAVREKLTKDAKFRDAFAKAIKKGMFLDAKNSAVIAYLDRLNELDENPVVNGKTLNFNQRAHVALRRLRGDHPDAGGEGADKRMTYSPSQLESSPFNDAKLLSDIGVGAQERQEWESLFDSNSEATAKYRGRYLKALAQRMIRVNPDRARYWEAALKNDRDPGYNDRLNNAQQDFHRVASVMFKPELVTNDGKPEIKVSGAVGKIVAESNKLAAEGKLPKGLKLSETLERAMEYYRVQEIPRINNVFNQGWETLKLRKEAEEAKDNPAAYAQKTGAANNAQVEWLSNTRKVVDSREYQDQMLTMAFMADTINKLAADKTAGQQIATTALMTHGLLPQLNTLIHRAETAYAESASLQDPESQARTKYLAGQVASLKGDKSILEEITKSLDESDGNPAKLSPRALYFMATNVLPGQIMTPKRKPMLVINQEIYKEGSVATKGGLELNPNVNDEIVDEKRKVFNEMFSEFDVKENPVAHILNRVARLKTMEGFINTSHGHMTQFLKKRAAGALP